MVIRPGATVGATCPRPYFLAIRSVTPGKGFAARLNFGNLITCDPLSPRVKEGPSRE